MPDMFVGPVCRKAFSCTSFCWPSSSTVAICRFVAARHEKTDTIESAPSFFGMPVLNTWQKLWGTQLPANSVAAIVRPGRSYLRLCVGFVLSFKAPQAGFWILTVQNQLSCRRLKLGDSLFSNVTKPTNQQYFNSFVMSVACEWCKCLVRDKEVHISSQGPKAWSRLSNLSWSEVTPVTLSVAGSHVNVKATLSDCYTVVFCAILLSLILNLEVYWTWTCPWMFHPSHIEATRSCLCVSHAGRQRSDRSKAAWNSNWCDQSVKWIFVLYARIQSLKPRCFCGCVMSASC